MTYTEQQESMRKYLENNR